MVIGIGTDIVSIERIRSLPEAAVTRLLTEAEQKYCRKYTDPSERIAGRFAAKEAIMKALGTGWAQGLGWRQIEILPNLAGVPMVTLTGAALEKFMSVGASHCLVSISHEQHYAVAYALLSGSSLIDPLLTQTSS
jgi:holo-[acyl-carrier protein] synthase